MTFTNSEMIDSISEISYKIHIIIGFGAGMFSSLVLNNIDDFLVTFLMGACGALGAGLVKLLTDWARKGVKKKALRDIIREEIEDYNESS